MVDPISRQLRREIEGRAGGRCEYCLVPAWIMLAGCEVDHVISRKHGGKTESANLALSCARCNRAKGSDIGSLDSTTGTISRLFNPRLDRWSDHFGVDGGRLVGRTSIGVVTISLLRLNHESRIEERLLLQQIGEYLKSGS